MGVADNKTYKDMTHFRGQYFDLHKDEVPSINADPKINTSIKENPYRANVEIEKDEVVLTPDLSALFLARGKKHSGGGIEVNLKPDSFIFSNDKSLAFTEKDHDLYEFKKGGSFAKKKNTPARVLRRIVDLEHYNRLTANLEDPQKDELAKKSSARMLEKYISNIGTLAYAQEAKKDFPDGIPEFALGTAPVYKAEVKDDIMSNKQFAKYGGTITNPYMPTYQRGGTWSGVAGNTGGITPEDLAGIEALTSGAGNIAAALAKRKAVPRVPGTVSGVNQVVNGYPMWLKAWRDPKTEAGRITSTGQPSVYEGTDEQLRKDYDYWKGIAGKDFGNPAELQKFVYDYHLKNDPNSVAEMWSKWGQTNGQGDNPILNSENIYNTRKLNPDGSMALNMDLIGSESARNNFLDKPGTPYLGARTMFLLGKRPQTTTTPAITRTNIVGTTPTYTPQPIPGPEVPEIPTTGQGVKRADWQFTPWQRVSQGYNLGKYAAARRYMPYRSHLNASYVDPSLVNPEQAIGDMQSAANQQIGALSSVNPILRNAQAAGAYGQLLNRVPGVRSQYDNQNAGIKNQFRQYNNQIANTTRATNMANDQQYYQQSVVGRQNFDNMKTFLSDQFMNNLLGDVQDNQTLAYNLLTQDNPAYGFDWKSGNFTRNPKNILDVQSDTKSDFYTQVAQTIFQKIQSGQTPTKQEVDFFKGLSMGKIPFSPPMQKKGGKVKRYNPYK